MENSKGLAARALRRLWMTKGLTQKLPNWLCAIAALLMAVAPTAYAQTAPTLTAMASVVASGNEDAQIAVSFEQLAAQGNEADVDGTVTAFVVKAVSTGTLKIGTSATAATAWAVGSNDVVDATRQAYWTPAANANGTL